MATNDSKRAFEAKRSNLWMFDPEELYLIEDEHDPLYDPRIKLPLDQSLVSNILYHGVIEPVVIVKREGLPIVVDGRQRVKAAREAAKISKQQGGPEIRVPAVLRHSDDRGLLAVMISANEIRRDDGPSVKAQKCQKLLGAGFTESELATVFGVTGQTIRNWLSVLEVAPAVRKAIDRGEVAATIATTIKNLPREQQMAAIDQAKAASKKGRATVKATRSAPAAGPVAPRMRNRVEIESRMKERGLPKDYRDALKWVLRVD